MRKKAVRNYNKTCSVCKKDFKGVHNQIWCSEQCSPYSLKGSEYFGLTTGIIGALSELRVSADLMKQGFHVFRALSPSAPCDLLIFKNGKIFKIEVRTARVGATGKISYPGKKSDRGKSDHFALALSDRIVYVPELEIESRKSHAARAGLGFQLPEVSQ